MSEALPTTPDVPPGGHVAARCPVENGLRNPPAWLREQIVSLIDRCAVDAADGPFLEHEHEPAGPSAIRMIETVTWALVCLKHVHADDRLTTHRHAAAQAYDDFFNVKLRLYQSEEDQTKAVGSWRMHNDGVCRDGMRLIDVVPRPAPQGAHWLAKFPWAPDPRDPLDQWLEQTWSVGPRRGTKEIYQFLVLYRMLQRIESADDLDAMATRALTFLDEHRDPDTGFIGGGEGVRPGWAMRGHRNMVIALHWPLQLDEGPSDRIIDATLACQRDDGHFDDGGMCANMDAIELLAEHGLRTGHRVEAIVAACRRCIAAIFRDLAHPGGGFHFEPPGCGFPEHRVMRLVNGAAFMMHTLRFWQAIEEDAAADLDRVLHKLGVTPRAVARR